MDHVKRQKIGWLTQKQSDFDYIAGSKLRETLFKGSVLARPYNGTLESVENISLDDIKTFIHSHLGYNNVIAVAGGDLSFNEAEYYVKEILELLPKVAEGSIETLKASDKKRDSAHP